MKKPRTPYLRSSYLILILSLLTNGNANTQPDADGSANNAKDHHFFVGVNLDVTHEDQLYPVVGLRQSQVMISVDGSIVEKPINNLGAIQYRKEIKLSNNIIHVDNISCEEGYSMYNDPEFRAMNLNNTVRDLGDQSMDRMMDAQRTLAEAEGTLVATEALPRVDASQIRGAMEQVLEASEALQEIELGANTYQSDVFRAEGQIKKDVLKVSFDISSAKNLENPYLMMIASLKESKGSKADTNWFYLRKLERMTANRLNSVYFVAESFPDGMILDDYDLYFFSGAIEVPSNLSPKRVDMTRKQAHAFMVYQYINKNFGKTRDAQLVDGVLSRKILRYQDSDLLDRKIRIKIDSDGKVVSIDPGRGAPTDSLDSLVDLLRSTMYYPALKEGAPVEGEINFVLRNAISDMGERSRT